VNSPDEDLSIWLAVFADQPGFSGTPGGIEIRFTGIETLWHAHDQYGWRAFPEFIPAADLSLVETAIPEPGSTGLFAGAFLTLAVARRLTRRS
jgi:hypothetical protein